MSKTNFPNHLFASFYSEYVSPLEDRIETQDRIIEDLGKRMTDLEYKTSIEMKTQDTILKDVSIGEQSTQKVITEMQSEIEDNKKQFAGVSSEQ